MDKLQILEQMILGGSGHVADKHRLLNVASAGKVRKIIEESTLCEEDKALAVLLYVKKKDMSFAADMLGYSESTVKRHNKRIVQTLVKLL